MRHILGAILQAVDAAMCPALVYAVESECCLQTLMATTSRPCEVLPEFVCFSLARKLGRARTSFRMLGILWGGDVCRRNSPRPSSREAAEDACTILHKV